MVSEFSTAPCMATYRVIGQESAEAIAGMETTTLGGMVAGEAPTATRLDILLMMIDRTQRTKKEKLQCLLRVYVD